LQKDDLKSLVTQMYDNLIENIDNQSSVSKEQVVNYLKESVDVISSISDEKIDSIEHAKSAFNNAYKEIANKSISSYEHTNERFEKLTQMHEETLNSCINSVIDLPSITEKFNDIQTHMMDEVKKANTIITQLSSQVETLEKNSNLDSLTKVFNRRALSTHLDKMCARENIKYSSHLLILDIDDFKVINDTYGHLVGDKALQSLALIFNERIRKSDIVARWGGEEFVLALHVNNKNEAVEVVEMIKDGVSAHKFEHFKHLTCSFGLSFVEKDEDKKVVFERADKALYQAKQEGKNRVVVFST